MNDDQLLLANAYLDDEIDDDDRSRAEADAEVMAEVARLRAVRDELRAVEAPDGTRRERSLAAALAAFDAESADTRKPLGPRAGTVPVPFPRRPRRAWWGVGAAAAAVVLVVGAGVALLGGSDDDDRGGDSAAVQEDLTAATEAARAAESRSEADAAATTAAEGADAGAPAAPADPTTSLGAATADTSSAPLTPSAGLAPVLGTPTELSGYVASTGEAATTPPATCRRDGTYYGRVVYAGTPVEVFATPTEIVAVDATTCAVVERVAR